MNRNRFRWLINPLFLLVTATCGNTSLQGGNCASDVDSDSDGLNDDIECQIGTDPKNPDFNGDGLSDGEAVKLGLDPKKLDTDGDGVPDAIEVKQYPKICVAQDRSMQVRPPISCTTDAECQAQPTGVCTGLNPKVADTDGDGVNDGDEDRGYNGVIDFASGETDPRLWDTDGDGLNDGESGSRICRPDGLAMINRAGIGAVQLGSAPDFGTAVPITGTTQNRIAAVVDDAAAGVAGMVISRPNVSTDVRADSTAIETMIQTTLTTAGRTISPILVGATIVTHEQFQAIQSSYLITTTASSSASAQRDALINALTGGTAPGGATAGSGSTTFRLDVTTVRRGAALNDIIVAVSPTGLYNDVTKATAIRVDDLVNATGVADGGQELDYQCQGIVASRLPAADFIWTVDVSGSVGDDQARIGNAATTFAQKLTSAGIDYRVGVFAADGAADPALSNMTFVTSNATIDSDPNFPVNGWKNGFKMLPGSLNMVDRWLCRFVTSTNSGTQGYCPADGNATVDPYFPFGTYASGDAREEPAAAAVRINDVFKGNVNNQNADWKWRPNATKVAFMITDEFGNDWTRYFQNANNPDDITKRFAPGGTYSSTVLANIVNYFKSNQLLTYGMVPLDANPPRACNPNSNFGDIPRCVIEGTGGAYLNIVNSTQAQVDAAIDSIATAVIGASSPITLSRSPITSTIQVTVRNTLVPRSRSNGFDYNQASRSIVFYGSTYRPNLNDTVYVSYRVWKNSLG